MWRPGLEVQKLVVFCEDAALSDKLHSLSVGTCLAVRRERTQMGAHRWEDPLPWQHWTQSPFYHNLFTSSSILSSFSLAHVCGERLPGPRNSLLVPIYSLALLSNRRLFPFQNLLFLRPKFKSELCEFPGFHKPSFKRTILLCIANINIWWDPLRVHRDQHINIYFQSVHEIRKC